jgi:DNA-binding transcriptional MocR family regulator
MKAARHVRLYHWMMGSAAWKGLSGNQRAIYVEMAARYNGFNNGRIPYSVREAANSLGIGKSTAARDLAVLRERGFIVPTTKGAFSLKVRHATEWRLTEFSSDVRPAMATKDFTHWSPEIQNAVPSQNGSVPLMKTERYL